jgi:hypothetical protein
LCEVLTKNFLDELGAGKDSSVLTNGSDQAEVQEVADVLVSLDLVLEVGDDCVFGLVFVKELLPFLLEASNTLRQLLVEEGVVVAELVLGKSNNVEPYLLVHPVVLLVTVIDTGTSLEEDTDVCVGKNISLDEDLECHHQLEGSLVSFEETSVDVSVHLLGQSLDNVLHTIFDELSLG